MAMDDGDEVKRIVNSDGWDLAEGAWEDDARDAVPYRKMTREELKAALVRDGIIKRKKG